MDTPTRVLPPAYGGGGGDEEGGERGNGGDVGKVVNWLVEEKGVLKSG